MKVLVVAPHPDDETLGCGGTLLKHKSDNDDVYWLIITGMDNNYSKERKVKREEEIKKVSLSYKFKGSYDLKLPTSHLDMVPISKIVSLISDIVNKVKPDIIYLPNPSDIHTDHGIVFKAAYSCTKNFRFPFIRKILIYETLSETEFSPIFKKNTFIPNVFIDITEFLEKKIEIFKIYETEVMEEFSPRSIETIKALAGYRGRKKKKKYAEAFSLLFEIKD